MKKKLIIFVICLFFATANHSCRSLGLCEPEKLSFARTNFLGTQLRTRGYYYGDSIFSEGEYSVKVVLLYRNGIFLNNYPIKLSKFFFDPQLPIVSSEVLNNRQYHWGIFKIDNQKLTIEYWNPSFDGCPKVVKEEADILNDTTFVIKGKNKIYRFRASLVKPDSTNNFIK
jgi:hypothetical protein